MWQLVPKLHLHLNHFSQLHYFTEQTVSFLPYIRFSEELLSKFMTFRNRKMPSMGLSVALQTSIYFRIICSQSASDVLCTPISKLSHNLHTLQLFQNCLTVTYRYHLHVGPLICSFRIKKKKKYLLQKNTKSSARTAVFWLLPAFAFTQSINRKTLPNSAKRSNNVPPHHVLVSHSELRQPPEESRFQFFPTRTQQDRKKNAHALVVLCSKAEPSGANQTKQLTCSERSRQSAPV